MPRVAVISDTHNPLRPEAVEYLSGSDHIIHVGDVCVPTVLEQIRQLAPLTVVRGNNDFGPWAESIRKCELLEISGVYLYVIHDLAEMSNDPAAAGVQVVISGHSHEPSIFEKDSVV